MGMVDRFLVVCSEARHNRLLYQLTCMAALYTTCKMHEHTCLTPRLLASFSDGMFSAQDVQRMEAKLLQGLQWRICPPTCEAFVHQLLELVPSLKDKNIQDVAFDLSICQTESSDAVEKFMTVPKSCIAYAAVMNTLETLLDYEEIGQVGYELSKPLEMDCNDPMLLEIQHTLYETLNENSAFELLLPPPPAEEQKGAASFSPSPMDSPRLVASRR